MIVVRHRRNTAAELADVPSDQGVEIDLRSFGNRLVVQHEAFADGEDFEAWIGGYDHRLLIANVKEEGLEPSVLETLAEHGVEDFFFLDQSFPFLVRTVRSGERRCAVRVSDLEDPRTAHNLAGSAEWVWFDSFTPGSLRSDDLLDLRVAGFRVCLVSPELHAPERQEEIEALQKTLDEDGVVLDAVCTKLPEAWSR